MEKKITLATLKSFIKKNRENLYINVKSHFDGMVDCVMPCEGGFVKAETTDQHIENTQGVNGAWFVRSSCDWFKTFENETLTGYEVSNCCGSFILAIEKPIELTGTMPKPIEIKPTFQNNKVIAFWNGLQFVSL